MEEKVAEYRRPFVERLRREKLLKSEREEIMREMNKMIFLKATWKVNQKNLPEDYIERARRSALDPVLFEAEYLCKRPRRVKDGFYALLDESHFYNDFDYDFYKTPGQAPDCRGDRDLVKGEPLLIGVDWGAAINCLTVNQYLKSINEYRTIKSMYVLGDDKQIQDDLFYQFHEYYQWHDTKEVHLFYDNQGNQATGITKETRAQRAAAQLRSLGWKVRMMTIGGSNPRHELTYLTWQYLLRGDYPGMPAYRVNKSNCRELIISMQNAGTKQDRYGIHKDKSSEKSSVIPRQHATDLSDANDKPVIALFSSFLRSSRNMTVQTRL